MKSLIVGIAGGSGSGKTTLANSILNLLGKDKACIIQHDNYYHDNCHIPFALRRHINYDRIEAFDNERFVKDIRAVASGNSIKIPIYDFFSHARLCQVNEVIPKKIVILEGILLFCEEKVRQLLHLKIFVEADSDLRFIRRLKRDIAERGRDLSSSIEQYLSTVKPMHDSVVEPSKKYADIVVSGDSDIKEIAIEIVNRIEKLELNPG